MTADKKRELLNLARHLKHFSKNAIIALLFSLAIYTTGCYKPEDNIADAVEAYNKIAYRADEASGRIEGIDLNSSNIIYRLQPESDTLGILESEIERWKALVKIRIERGEIQTVEGIKKVDDLSELADSRYKNAENKYFVVYNGSLDEILNSYETTVSENRARLDSLENSISSIKAQMEQIKTELNSRMTFPEIITTIQALDENIDAIEGLENNIITDLNSLRDNAEFTQASYDEGIITLSEDQLERFEDLKTLIINIIGDANESISYIENVLEQDGSEIVNLINSKLSNDFNTINNANTSINSKLNQVYALMQDFVSSGGTQEDIDTIIAKLNEIQSLLNTNSARLTTMKEAIDKIVSDLFGETPTQNYQTAKEDHDANQTRHNQYEEETDGYQANINVVFIEDILNGIIATPNNVLVLNSSNNTINISTAAQWNYFCYNILSNDNLTVNYDIGELNLNLSNVEMNKDQIRLYALLANNEDFEFNSNFQNVTCTNEGDATLSDLDKIIDFSSIEISGQAIPHNPNNNNFSEAIFDVNNQSIDVHTGNRIFPLIGQVGVTNYVWDGYFACDFAEISNYENTTSIPCNYVFNFTGNGTIESMILGSPEYDLSNYVKTLSDSNIPYMDYIDNISISQGISFTGSPLQKLLDKSGKFLDGYEEALNALKIIGTRDEINFGPVGFVGTQEAYSLVNTEAITKAMADVNINGYTGSGIRIEGLRNVILISDDNDVPVTVDVADGETFVATTSIILANITSPGEKIQIKRCMFNKISNASAYNSGSIFLSLNPSVDADFTRTAGDLHYFLSNVSGIDFNSNNVDVGTICYEDGDILFLNEILGGNSYGGVEGNTPVIAGDGLMDCNDFQGLEGHSINYWKDNGTNIPQYTWVTAESTSTTTGKSVRIGSNSRGRTRKPNLNIINNGRINRKLVSSPSRTSPSSSASTGTGKIKNQYSNSNDSKPTRQTQYYQ